MDSRKRIWRDLKMPRCGLMSGMRVPSKSNPALSSLAVNWPWISVSLRTCSKARRRIRVSLAR